MNLSAALALEPTPSAEPYCVRTPQTWAVVLAGGDGCPAQAAGEAPLRRRAAQAVRPAARPFLLAAPDPGPGGPPRARGAHRGREPVRARPVRRPRAERRSRRRTCCCSPRIAGPEPPSSSPHIDPATRPRGDGRRLPVRPLHPRGRHIPGARRRGGPLRRAPPRAADPARARVPRRRSPNTAGSSPERRSARRPTARSAAFRDSSRSPSARAPSAAWRRAGSGTRSRSRRPCRRCSTPGTSSSRRSTLASSSSAPSPGAGTRAGRSARPTRSFRRPTSRGTSWSASPPAWRSRRCRG